VLLMHGGRRGVTTKTTRRAMNDIITNEINVRFYSKSGGRLG
jgi:hypothetical protein